MGKVLYKVHNPQISSATDHLLCRTSLMRLRSPPAPHCRMVRSRNLTSVQNATQANSKDSMSGFNGVIHIHHADIFTIYRYIGVRSEAWGGRGFCARAFYF